MKPIPFRFKIALLSLLISGGVLVVFGITCVAVIHRIGVERVDGEIRTLADLQLRSHHGPDYWPGFERSLRFLYGEDSTARLAVQVRDANRQVRHTSAPFPPELAALPWPRTELLPPREPPPRPVATERSDEQRPGPRFPLRMDQSGDGRVSREEFAGAKESFDAIDRNTDGYLDESEFVARFQGSGGRRPFGRDEGPPGGRPTPPRMQRPVFQTVRAAAGEWRVGFLGNEYVSLLVAMDLAGARRDVRDFLRVFGFAVPLALLALAAGGWWLALRALRPVAAIARTAEGITARGLNRRVPEVAADAELARLVEIINRMLDRLERSFDQAVRFSADAAHELQTPLTVLQGELDQAVQDAPDGSDEQRRCGGLLEEVRRLKAIVQKLLLLARADAGQLALHRGPVDLGALLEAAAEDAEAMAPGLRIERDFRAGVLAPADPDLLAQAVRNLAVNAVKYNEPAGLVRFELAVTEAEVRVTVRNTGAPIPAEDRDRIFDRFYRVDKARSREVGGSGLGLSLAREIARAHGGDLVLEPAEGLLISFTLSLPRAAAG